MYTAYRGLTAGFLIAGVAALFPLSSGAQAQEKKDDLSERITSVTTSDGLSLKGYWFQGVALERQRPDAVMMFPTPGNKITDAWVDLARSLSEKNFSVLLFDWRGCGMNGPDGQGTRVFDSTDLFWKEPYNGSILKSRQAAINKFGLDWKVLATASGAGARYRDFMFNDLLAARFFLDKQSDAGRCNTNRVWVVSEKDGAHMGMAFIASEFHRNTKYVTQGNIFDTGVEFRAAGKDYAGLIALSYTPMGPMSPSANMVYRNALPTVGATDRVKEGIIHLEDRLAMVLMHTKKEGAGASRGLAASVRATGDEAAMKKKFKYIKEFDVKVNKPISGIDLIDPMDSFGAKAYVVDAAVGISKVQPQGKDPTDREAAKTLNPPRFDIERFNKR